MVKKKVNVFISYAHKNKKSANELLDKLGELLAPSKSYTFDLWIDKYIEVGEKWQERILTARDEADIGLLFISPAFLSSKFINEKELPVFIGDEAKPMIPLMLSKVDFDRHDLKGLEEYQIFCLNSKKFKESRAYADLKPKRRDDFAWQVFQLIHNKLEKK
jgi:hypothetical protein